MKNFILLSIVALVSASASGFDGGSRGGGGFADFSGGKPLFKIKEELARQVQVLPQRLLLEKQVPPKWTPERIANVIKALKINSSPESLKTESNGKMKIFDYDETSETISALVGFFLYYGPSLSESPLNKRVTDEIKQKILHEVSHLWGFYDDDKAFAFSQTLVTKINYDAVSCNFKVMNKKKEEWKHLTFTFGIGGDSPTTGGFYFGNGAIGFNNDDSYVTLPIENFSMMTAGSYEVTSDSIVILAGGPIAPGIREYRLTVNRKTENQDEDEAQGVFESTDPRSKRVTTKNVKCSIPNPR